MSGSLTIRAPGKLFVLGEYAVLDGCPALVAAVDRYAQVRVVRTKFGAPVRVQAPALAAPVEFDGGQPPSAEGPLRFALSAFRAAARHLPELRSGGLNIEVTSNLDATAGIKTGLGSSAAVSVAMVAALFAAVGRDPSDARTRDEVFAASFGAHRDAQTGLGSGADVAASCYGGLVRVEPCGELPPVVRRFTFPADASLLVGWTGESASTPALVQRYLTASNGSAAVRATFVRQTRDCVDMFLNALALRLLSCAALNIASDLLRELGEKLALPLWTPALGELVRIARTHGAGAKLSGAGGGDCGIALMQQPEIAERIRQAWRAAGITLLDLQLDRQGVSVASA